MSPPPATSTPPGSAATRVADRIRAWRRALRRRRKRLARQHDAWSIGILTGPSPFDLDGSKARNPVLTRRDVRDVPAAFVADPFMIRVGGEWYMFFEVLNRLRGKGEIGVATSRDGLRWRYRQIVLREPFHLSYPHVFEWNGGIYMIPESHEAGSVRLYYAVAFPERWAPVATLLEGATYNYPTPFHHAGSWWLLTETNPAPRSWDTLRLFMAASPAGPWTEHPRSPVVAGVPDAARPAGRVLRLGRRLYRLAQVCTPDYGTAIRVFEIVELTADTYREREAWPGPLLGPGDRDWNATGIHHLDVQRVDDDRWIGCVDGCGRRAAGVQRRSSGAA